MPLYNSFKSAAMKADIDLETDTIKCALFTSSYTPNIDTQDFYNDLTGEVAAGGGYTSGGQALANKTVTTDNTDDEGVFDADDVAWTSSTITARYAVLYKDTGVASTSALIGYIDFSTDQSSVNATFTIARAAEGIINLN